jgi:hypothetical protein
MSGGFPKLETLADIESVEETPLADRLEAPDVFGCLKAAAKAHAERTAIIDIADPARPETAREWTYAQAFEQMVRAANALWSIGRGKPVGYLSCRIWPRPISFFGAQPPAPGPRRSIRC